MEETLFLFLVKLEKGISACEHVLLVVEAAAAIQVFNMASFDGKGFSTNCTEETFH